MNILLLEEPDRTLGHSGQFRDIRHMVRLAGNFGHVGSLLIASYYP